MFVVGLVITDTLSRCPSKFQAGQVDAFLGLLHDLAGELIGGKLLRLDVLDLVLDDRLVLWP